MGGSQLQLALACSSQSHVYVYVCILFVVVLLLVLCEMVREWSPCIYMLALIWTICNSDQAYMQKEEKQKWFSWMCFILLFHSQTKHACLIALHHARQFREMKIYTYMQTSKYIIILIQCFTICFHVFHAKETILWSWKNHQPQRELLITWQLSSMS